MAKGASAEPVKVAVESNSAPAVATKASDSKLNPDLASAGPEESWICVCCPTSDCAAEAGIDPDDEDDTIEELCGGGLKCLCRKPADEHPEHTWILTKTGFELVLTWQQDQMKREPDAFGMYVYNDFAAYGLREVMDNMLLAFDKEAKKKTRVPMAMWSHIEGMAWFFNGDLFHFHTTDDPEANAHCLSLVGTALLTTLEVLIEHNLFIPASITNPIRNIGLVLSRFISSDTTVLRSELCDRNETGWLVQVVKMADEHQVEIEGVYGIEEKLKEIRDAAAAQKPKRNRKPPAEKKRAWSLSQDFNSQGKRLWRRWDWKRELAKYSSEWAYTPPHGGDCAIGGHNYDLSNKETMQRAKRWERIQYGTDYEGEEDPKI